MSTICACVADMVMATVKKRKNILNWTEKEDFDPSVINGGVKPNSVLLDLDLKAKIGDFSWQRLETDDEVDRESQVVVVEEEDKGEIEKEES
ncbi:hypothetical protein ACLB2K_057712 [Fragaria x ananassa]